LGEIARRASRDEKPQRNFTTFLENRETQRAQRNSAEDAEDLFVVLSRALICLASKKFSSLVLLTPVMDELLNPVSYASPSFLSDED
jgi:hypothetical protein